tara:strand:- start:200 stop:1138 length:939 start_codon:yes stop_codon:yes gene_type:complete
VSGKNESKILALTIVLIFLLSLNQSSASLYDNNKILNSIPDDETKKGDVAKDGGGVYWLMPNGSIHTISRLGEGYNLIFDSDEDVTKRVSFINLDEGENYTVNWKHYASEEFLESGSFNITVTNSSRENTTYEFNISNSNIIQVHLVNVSIYNSTGTLLDWNWGGHSVWYDWDWIDESTDWKEGLDVKASDGEEISFDFELVNLKPGQNYNLSWSVWDNDPEGAGDYPMIYDGGYEVISSVDGTYDGTISFEYVEGTSPCVEYTLAIDDWRGQTMRKCIGVSEDSFSGIPWASSMLTIVAIFGALVIFSRKH